MAEVRNHLQFLLNDEIIHVSDAAPTDTLLDYLRLNRRLTGTKEGCAEGDCGACTVLVGRLVGESIQYETVNACIRFMGSLDGCHVVTVEHLRRDDGSLHPVQQAMVDCHASQCGFCTPGFVMSLYALWMRNPNPSMEEAEVALQGNLCRCTGYETIIKAAFGAGKLGEPKNDPLVSERNAIITKLQEMRDGMRVEIGDEQQLMVPASVEDFADLRAGHPESTIVAGSTDVGLWVTKFMRPIAPAIFIGNLDELRTVETVDNSIHAGALASYSDMMPLIEERLPQLAGFWKRIGGEQVRNMGTVGGNIANGSPIGDTPPPLIALGAKLVLQKGEKRRTVDLQDFFIDYGKQDREEGDFVAEVIIPLPKPDDLFAAYKISKRRDEDISSVSCAIHASMDGETVREVSIAFGGMAATPKRATAAEKALKGATLNEKAIQAAQAALENDFKPITDWRASSEYRLLVAKNLLMRFYLENMDKRVAGSLNRYAVA